MPPLLEEFTVLLHYQYSLIRCQKTPARTQNLLEIPNLVIRFRVAPMALRGGDNVLNELFFSWISHVLLQGRRAPSALLSRMED